VTPQQSRLAFAVLAGISFVVLVALGLGMTFFADEWAFIEARALSDPSTWFTPHNEHWSTVPVVVYRALVETVGTGSYVPYQVLLVALHLGVAAVTYLLVERRSGAWLGLGAGAIILFYGSGFENLYWGFQIGLVASVLLGLLALRLTDGPEDPARAAAVAGLLLLSMASQGIGLVMAVAVGLEWALDRRWRPWFPLLAIPALAYLAWYVGFGNSGIASHRDPFTVEALLDVPAFVALGLANAISSVTGLAGPLAPIGAAVLALLVARSTGADRSTSRAVSLLVAIVVMYALIGLVRADVVEGQANYTRYTYVAGVLLLVAISSSVGRPEIPQPTHRLRVVVLGSFGAWFALAMALNVALLLGGRELFQQRAAMTRALVTVALDPDPPIGAQLERSLVLVPSAASTRDIARRYGDPRSDHLVPWAVRRIPEAVLREAERRLVEGAPVPVTGSD
jgi:hypothetical protein